MKIMITAGGTCEQIDNVRSITNTSTGKLGSLIADAFSGIREVEKIVYICSRKAVLPQAQKVEIIHVDDVASLERAVRDRLGREEMDIIVHSMAVSDYRVKSVTSASMLADSMNAHGELLKDLNPQSAEAIVSELFKNAGTIINSSGKISSNIDELILLMERTPKIISLFQSLSPRAVLVGFKLLDHVAHDTLIDTAYSLLKENKCKLVLANDLSDISEEKHIGYLIGEDKSYKEYTTKQEIADAIATAAIGQRRN